MARQRGHKRTSRPTSLTEVPPSDPESNFTAPTTSSQECFMRSCLLPSRAEESHKRRLQKFGVMSKVRTSVPEETSCRTESLEVRGNEATVHLPEGFIMTGGGIDIKPQPGVHRRNPGQESQRGVHSQQPTARNPESESTASNLQPGERHKYWFPLRIFKKQDCSGSHTGIIRVYNI